MAAGSGEGTYYSPLLLQAMLLYALRCSATTLGFADSQEGGHAASLPFRRTFEQLLYGDHGRTACRSRITTIQALLLMSDVLFAWLDEKSVAWHYLGMAINMIVDLGMHSEQNIIMSEDLHQLEWLETRRRVFWAGFSEFTSTVPPTPNVRPRERTSLVSLTRSGI